MQNIVFSSFLAFISLNSVSATGWHPMHPGGGGQVQSIAFDPNQDGKAFFNSDMEGTSISTDNGVTWINTGTATQKHLHQHVTTVEPGNSNRVYNGGLYGLDISNDGGYTWAYEDFFRPTDDRGTVSCIAVDPSNVNRVYVGHGWINRPDRLNKVDPINVAVGPRVVAYSTNRGASWQKSTYIAGDGNKETYTLQVLSNGDVYLAAEAGLFKSTNNGSSWSQIANPSGVSGACRGAIISPNEQYMYAAFQVGSGAYRVYATKVSPIAWTDITGNLDTSKSWWRPEIDGRDTGSSHHILIGGAFIGGVSKLWEANVSWNGATPTPFTWREIFDQAGGTNYSYEAGWRETQAKARTKGYTPASWAERRVWVSSDEGIYVGDPNADVLSTWEPIWTKKTADGGWITRGFESTFNWSMGGHGSFLAQGQGDNGFVHSFNDGESWRRDNLSGINDCGAIEVIPTSPYPIVIIAGTSGFGGGDLTGNGVGRVYIRRLNSDTKSWFDNWRLVGGDEAGLNGINHNPKTDTNGNPYMAGSRVYSMAKDPFSTNRIYLGTQRGVYRHDNLGSLAAGNDSNFIRISNAAGNLSVKKVVADPNLSGVIYVMQQDGTYRVNNANGSNPTWTKIIGTGRVGLNASADLQVSNNNGSTYLFVGDSENLYISTNSGGSNVNDGFTQILDRNDVLATRPPSLEPWFETGDILNIGSIAAVDNIVYVAFDSSYIHGYGVLKGTLSGTSATWEDWTNSNAAGEKLPLSRSRRAEIITTNGTAHYYIATSGMGMWRRDISEPGVSPAPPSTYEAEDRNAQGNTSIETTYPGYTGSGYLVFNGNGSYMTWNTVNEGAGNITFYFRYANGTSQNLPCEIKLNGQIDVGVLNFSPTGSWSNWATESMTIPLNNGNNVVRVRASTNASGPHFDNMATADSNQPEPEPETNSVYPAEDYAYGGNITIQNNFTGYYDSGYVDFGGNGSYFAWNTVNEGSGNTTFYFRYANGTSGDMPCEIKLNGQIDVGVLDFPPTGSWTTWNTLSIAIPLNNGNNTVRVRANSNAGGPNLDQMSTQDSEEDTATYSIYAAEDYAYGGNVTIQSAYSGYNDAGYVDFTGNGSYFAWNTVDEGSGTRTFFFRYANGTSGNMPCEIKLNGQIDVGVLNFAPTGSWTNWQTESIAIPLANGNNTVRVRANSNVGGPNLDEMYTEAN